MKSLIKCTNLLFSSSHTHTVFRAEYINQTRKRANYLLSFGSHLYFEVGVLFSPMFSQR